MYRKVYKPYKNKKTKQWFVRIDGITAGPFRTRSEAMDEVVTFFKDLY